MPPARRLPKSARLGDGKLFVELLRGRRKTSGCLELAAGGKLNPECGARLGVVVGRKNLPRAVDRNTVKRIVREAFRLQRAELLPRDMLVRLRQRLAGRPPTEWKLEVATAIKFLLAGVKA